MYKTEQQEEQVAGMLCIANGQSIYIKSLACLLSQMLVAESSACPFAHTYMYTTVNTWMSAKQNQEKSLNNQERCMSVTKYMESTGQAR